MFDYLSIFKNIYKNTKGKLFITGLNNVAHN